MADILATLIANSKEGLELEFGSLQRQMAARFNEVNARFDAQAASIDRQHALLQSWYTSRSRMAEWSVG